MAESRQGRQILRKIALVLTYTLFTGFGSAVSLLLNDRELDKQAFLIIAILTAGALIAGIVITAARKFLPVRRNARFLAILVLTVLATAALQGLFAGGLFYANNIIQHYSYATLEGWVQMAFTTIQGSYYFLFFGLHLFWPLHLVSALLFALASLTLRAGGDRKD